MQSNWPIAEKEGILNKDLYSKTKMKRLIILEKTYSYETLYVLNSNGHGHNFKQKKNLNFLKTFSTINWNFSASHWVKIEFQSSQLSGNMLVIFCLHFKRGIEISGLKQIWMTFL